MKTIEKSYRCATIKAANKKGAEPVDFRELTYITTIAKHQNMTRAAEELYVSQPTLSKALQNVERELGQPLFTKLGNRFCLTYAGERYVERAREMLRMKKELDEEMHDIIRDGRGELRIAFPIMRGSYMLPGTLTAFRKEFPHVHVKVREASSAVLEDLLLSGEVDLAFFSLPIRRPEIEYEVIYHEEVLLVTAPGHPLANMARPRPQGLAVVPPGLLRKEPFILQLPDQRTRQIADTIFRQAKFQPRIVLETRNIPVAVELARDGFGVTLAGETHLRHIHLDPAPACFSLGLPCAQTDFVVAFRRGAYLPQYTQRFIEIVRQHV